MFLNINGTKKTEAMKTKKLSKKEIEKLKRDTEKKSGKYVKK